MSPAAPPSSAAMRKQAFADHVLELMSGMGAVEAKRMFGGHGIYLHGLMFALIIEERLYLKTDEQTLAPFQARGLPPFRYETRHGVQSSLSYYEAPPEVYDEREHMAQWARLGYECALRAQEAKRQRAGKGGKKGEASRKKASSAVLPAAASSSATDVASSSDATDLSAMRNLGPKSQAVLAKAGIKTVAQLRKLGAVQAYARVKAKDPRASLNLLWALEGALSGRDWKSVAETDRASLLMALEDVQRLASGPC